MSEQPRRTPSASGRNRALYVISVAAELAGVHAQTLRIYERKGLVAPARTSGGSRRYSDRDIAMLNRISQLTSEGLNLAGVKRVLELEERVAALERKLAECRPENRRCRGRDAPAVPARPGAAAADRSHPATRFGARRKAESTGLRRAALWVDPTPMRRQT